MNAAAFSELAWECVAGFLAALVVGWLLLRLLPRFSLRQTAYEDAPESHRDKTGTPTMGGLAILAAIAVSALFAHDTFARALLMLVFACALVGFVDDLIGIRSGSNAGLRARTKFLATALVAAIFMRMVPANDTLFHAGSALLVVPYWLWFVLGILAITGCVHAVNLTDGLDGLAAGAIAPPLYVFWALAIVGGAGPRDWPVVLGFAIGGALGFLVYNRHPARMFMGDTGSLALGALLAGAAILDGEMLLLAIVGGLFVAEALSVMLQVAYFKISGGRRIFLMSPLHHHFELAGWPERTVTLSFWLASTVCSVVGWVIGSL
ncbi:MAG TPA: phospho-N-acetylmuramoyl-pentapeptide-transferase [Candidatus Dormibacteraeota bacterium]|nr:phospho-N-acetylmuramoyl-pentapeptide-transferase [Candidatus Dormibacteraeota bacterium]